VPPSPSPHFEETMGQLNALVTRSRQRQQANLNRLAMMVAKLDVPFSEPSNQPEQAAASRSMPTPTPTRSEADDDALRAQLPARTTHGGPYGSSILDRVAANYGFDTRDGR